MKEDMQEKTKCHTQYRMTNGKGNNISKSAREYRESCHENQITYLEHKRQLQKKKKMSQTQHLPFAEQKKTPKST